MIERTAVLADLSESATELGHQQNHQSAYKILVVDCDPRALDALIRELRRHGHTAEGAERGAKALERYHGAELVLLDLELPDLDGLQVCRTIRQTSNIPIIAVTARGTELDSVLGFQAGVDDYVVKPYGFRELMARMEAVMRRAGPRPSSSPGPPRVVSHGQLTIDTRLREVKVGGRRITVTRKEFDLLLLLASHPDSVVPREQIMSQVWDDSWSPRTVDTHVSSLRGKLGGKGWILTVRGVGFRLGQAG
ncbi:response regulator transcription factor [Actinokineospora cianjurensis]|uniref:DNA-binding response OmpR family regulator n=1 Tax=Actinokineospora cianjurensis TaxID=585224 RepID=A0A421AW59_9PSEU|nr:response regulator transcription factor [Actinokineospora cianjurensis]RLK53990.1 DNA-binding response OmpR family regulator [Actinokineospora cianjurensis]